MSDVMIRGVETDAEFTAARTLAIEVFSHMDHLNPSYFVIDQIWRHSQKVGHSARMIARLYDALLVKCATLGARIPAKDLPRSADSATRSTSATASARVSGRAQGLSR